MLLKRLTNDIICCILHYRREPTPLTSIISERRQTAYKKTDLTCSRRQAREARTGSHPFVAVCVLICYLTHVRTPRVKEKATCTIFGEKRYSPNRTNARPQLSTLVFPYPSKFASATVTAL